MRKLTHALYGTALLWTLVSGSALAHGAGGVHLLGVVKTADAASVSLETKEGSTVTVRLDEKTRLERAGTPAQAAELQPGERVVVHAKKEDGGLVAQLAKLGKKKGAASPEDAGGGVPEHSRQPRDAR